MGKRHGVSPCAHIGARDRRKCWLCGKWKPDERDKFAYRAPLSLRGICVPCSNMLGEQNK